MRQSAEQIDQGILDVAAGFFAVHGFENTSLQQLADAVGYSKAGLLHRFHSKQALHTAAVDHVVTTVQVVLSEGAALPEGPDRGRQILELVARTAVERPGVVQMTLASFDPNADEPDAERVQAVGYRLVDLLDRPVSTPQERLRIVLAMQLVVNAAQVQTSVVDTDLHLPTEELIPFIVDLASGVLGEVPATA